jgi:hypothetical protein
MGASGSTQPSSPNPARGDSASTYEAESSEIVLRAGYALFRPRPVGREFCGHSNRAAGVCGRPSSPQLSGRGNWRSWSRSGPTPEQGRIEIEIASADRECTNSELYNSSARTAPQRTTLLMICNSFRDVFDKGNCTPNILLVSQKPPFLRPCLTCRGSTGYYYPRSKTCS